MKLKTTTEDLNEFHRAVDGTRKGSTVVKVDREKLRGLLNDHAEVIGELAKQGIYYQ